jgi:hypothetical protein
MASLGVTALCALFKFVLHFGVDNLLWWSPWRFCLIEELTSLGVTALCALFKFVLRFGVNNLLWWGPWRSCLTENLLVGPVVVLSY